MHVNVTEAAKQQISNICEKNDKKYVRLSILSGGCNGFSKSFDFDTEKYETDTKIDCYNGTLLIDDISIRFLENSIVDYITNLIGSSFSVTIPTASSSCGCGNSFSI